MPPPPEDVAARARVLTVGPLPPPANGMTMLTQFVVSGPLAQEFALDHVDTSDHRSIANVGRFDAMNVILAGSHAFRFAVRLLVERYELIYIPIARNRLGFLRDALFLLPTRLTRSRVIVHLHASGFDDFYRRERRWMRLLVGAALPQSAYGVVSGECLRDGFRVLPRDHVFVVPNGIPDVGPGLPAGDREMLVLHLGTQWSEKGVFDVLKAAARVAPQYPDARFVLAGGWLRESERRHALEFIRAHGLADAVELTGPVRGQQKADLLHRAAVMVFPTKYTVEAHPLVVLEAMSAGTPVITTGIGAIPEMVIDDVTGVLVGPSSPAQLGEALRRLLEDAPLRSRLGAAARTRYEEEFTLRAYQRRLGDVWRRVLAGRI